MARKGKGGRGQFRGLDSRSRRKRYTNKQDLPLPVGETQIRKGEGTRRWSWIKKTRKGNPDFRRVQDPIKNKSVRWRWDESWLLDWPEFKFTDFTPAGCQPFDWADPLRWPTGHPWGYQWWMWKWFGELWKKWIASGIKFPSWEFPTGSIVFQVPVELSSATIDEEPVKLATTCRGYERATVIIQCRDGGEIQFDTENPPVYAQLVDVWRAYHYIRIFRRSFYNYGKARNVDEDFGRILEFVELTHYAGYTEWEQTAIYSTALKDKADFANYYKNEDRPKGWSCFTRPVLPVTTTGLVLFFVLYTTDNESFVTPGVDFFVCDVPIRLICYPIGGTPKVVREWEPIWRRYVERNDEGDVIFTGMDTYAFVFLANNAGAAKIGDNQHEFYIGITDRRAYNREYVIGEGLEPDVHPIRTSFEDGFDRFERIIVNDQGEYVSHTVEEAYIYSDSNPYENQPIDHPNWRRTTISLRPGESLAIWGKWPAEGDTFKVESWDRAADRLFAVLISLLGTSQWDLDEPAVYNFTGNVWQPSLFSDEFGADPGKLPDEHIDITLDFPVVREFDEYLLYPPDFYRMSMYALSGSWTQFRNVFDGATEGGNTNTEITPDTNILAAEVVLVAPNNTETVVYRENRKPGEDAIWLDCAMVNAAESASLALPAHLYACRAEAFETIAEEGEERIKLLGQHTCYAPDAILPAIRPGTDYRTRFEIHCGDDDIQDEESRSQFRLCADIAERENQETSRSEPDRDGRFNQLRALLSDMPEETFSRLLDRLDPQPIAEGKPGIQNSFETEGHPRAPNAPIPLVEKDFPYSYRCTCPDYSDMAINEDGNGDIRTWDRLDIPVLVNGQRVCKHILKVMTMRGEIDEKDIPDDLPLED